MGDELLVKGYEALRNEFRRFTYESFDMRGTEDGFELSYKFEIEGLAEFSPKWLFPSGGRKPEELLGDEIFKRMAFNLGMAELVSYWKITCAPKVLIKAGYLKESQAEWWKKQYFFGLGEFFYLNGIEPDSESFMEIQTDNAGSEKLGDSVRFDLNAERSQLDGCLIPVGGGKDSITTLELLKDRFETNCCYVINPRGATEQSVITAGYPAERRVYVKRTLDKRMLELNAEGYLNGHTPFSAIVAFSSLLAAYVYRKKYVVLSNESSANEPTVIGSEINHQYSKSFEFERDFDLYEKEHIGSGISYFSLLRPFSEYQIAGFFARQEKYHKIFRSCNAGSKTDCWCGRCPKCLFVYVILSAFLDNAKLTDIFGRDMLSAPELSGTFDKLIGVVQEKPFECVGSRDEINTAICTSINRFYKGKNLPPLYEYYTGTEQYRSYKDKKNEYDEFFDGNHLIPGDFLEGLRDSFILAVNH